MFIIILNFFFSSQINITREINIKLTTFALKSFALGINILPIFQWQFLNGIRNIVIIPDNIE